MMIKRLTLLFTCILSDFASAQNEAQKYDEWKSLLGSGSFAERETITKEIWGEGRKALTFLETLIGGDDPELSARAVSVARKVKLGITPDTSEEIIKLIDQYFEASAKIKVSILEKLLAAEEYDILLRLREFEENPDVLQRVDTIIAEILPHIVRKHLNEDRLDLAKEYLALSDQFPHLIQYAHLFKVTGGLDAEIERLSKSKNPKDQARYLICLRVKGDAQKIREVSAEMGEFDTEILAALTLGDHVPYLESVLENSNPTLPSRHYINWTIANHQGNREAEKKAFDALVYLTNQKSERAGARTSLFRMGYGEFILKKLNDDEFDGKVGYLLSHDRYAEAQELMGFPIGEGFDDWLEGVAARAKKEIANSGPYSELDRLANAVEFLEERGLPEKALKGAFLLFDLVRSVSDLDTSSFARKIYYSAPLSAFTAIAREVKDHKANLEDFMEMLPLPAPDESLWLFSRLAEVYPEMDVKERLLIAISFSARRLLVPADQFKEARDRFFELVREEDDEVASLMNLFTLLVNRNREEDLLMLTRALSKAESSDNFIEAIVAVDGGRIKEGAEAFAKIVTDPSSVDPEFLYKKGLILKKAGMKEGEKVVKRALFLSSGSALSLRSFAMEHLRHGEIEKAYELMRQALLRTENPAESASSTMRNAIVEELAVEAVTLGRWENALAYREVSALDVNYLRGSVEFGIYPMRLRFQILIARGAIAMEKGDVVGAVKAFSRAHEILPNDGYLANDFFPLLRTLGLSELHNQLFAKSIRGCRENVQRYPEDDNAYNNFAWMASRANRCLDEAEEYLKIALKMNPESAAYLDTMGEIHFARRDREEAVRWSRKSLQNSVWGSSNTRWELQYQNQRFRLEGFPPR